MAYSYIVSSGDTVSGIILYGDSRYMKVESGGTANNTTVHDGGLEVYGGLVDNTTVNSDSYLFVESGGTAINTTINKDGTFNVLRGGVASNTTINFNGVNGWFHVASGGTANNTIINSGGEFRVSYGVTVNSVTVNQGGYLYIATDGATVRSIVENGGYVTIGKTNLSFIPNTINELTISSAGATVHSGTTANRTTLNSGYLVIYSGGIANDTLINASGHLFVSSGGTASSNTVNSGGILDVESGGTAIEIVENGGYVNLGSGAIANFKANSFSELVLDDKNSATVHSGTTANKVSVNAKTKLIVYSGGTANEVMWTPCNGYVQYENGTHVTFASQIVGVYYGGDGTLSSSAMMMENTTIHEKEEAYVMSDGTINSTTIAASGSMYVSKNGNANNTTIDSLGKLYVCSGGTATHIEASSGALLDFAIAPDTYIQGTYTDSAFEIKNGSAILFSINSGNSLHVLSGGLTSRATTYSGGFLDILAEGIASRTVVSGGIVRVSSGGMMDNTSVYGNDNDYYSRGGIHVLSGGLVNNTIINYPGSVHISSGGIANKITINEAGYLVVSSGGTATNVTVNQEAGLVCFVASDTYVTGTYGNTAFEIKDGVASNYHAINWNGCLNVLSGCTANNTLVDFGGSLCVYSGGVANNTEACDHGVGDAARIYVYSGGIVNNTAVKDKVYFCVLDGGKANNTVITGINDRRGWATISSGGIANGAIINSNGSMRLESGGVASDVTINSGGSLYAQGRLTGKITIAGGGVLQIDQGTVVDFDISTLAPGMGARVNNLSLFTDSSAAFTLTASDLQWNGTYALANGATEFDNLLSIKNSANETIQMIEVGETANVDGVEYTLTLADNTLSVTVTGGQDIPVIPVSADITAPTSQAVTVTADFSDTAVLREYSFDNDIWHVYSEPLTFKQNGVVYFLGKDQRGYVTESASYQVTNIDTTRPGTPSNQVSTVNGYTVNLSWSAASDTGSGIAKYEYRIATSSNYSQILESGTTETCAATVDGLKYGKYYWSVRAVDAAGNTGSWSTNKSFSTVDEVAPDIPVNLVCSVENQSTLSVSWDESKDDSLGRGLNRYEIQLASDEAFASIVKSLSTTVPSSTIGPLSKGDYYLRVCAVDNAGNKSDWTAAAAFTIETDTIPPTISNVKASISDPTNKNVTVTAEFADNVALQSSQYKIGNDGEWTDYKNGVIVTENTTVYFRAIDTNENETEANYEVNNIDKTKPVITLVGDNQTPLQSTTLSASTEDGLELFYSMDNKTWTQYKGIITVAENGTYYFKATDAAGNTGTEKMSFMNIDTTPPVLTLTADTVTLSNSVTLTAETNEDKTIISYSLDKKDWTTYESPLGVKSNGTIYFKAVDAAGNTGTAEIAFANIDAVAPTAPTALKAFVDKQDVALIWNISTDDFSGVKEYIVKYSHDDQEFTDRTTVSHFVLNNADVGTWSWSVQSVDFAGNESAIIAGETFTVSGLKPYIVEYSPDNFEHTFRFNVSSPTLNTFRMPGGTYQMRVRAEGNSEWTEGDPIVAEEIDNTPQLVKSDVDGNADIFFVNAIGTWESGYVAHHVGSINDWAGTDEMLSLFSKNKLADIIEGSTDANILLMTDDSNGDALFVDDIYTALPGSIAEQQARIAQIDEIRAGAGADIVDMTSQRFEYIGDGLTIRGGEGNDTIWANKGSNFLFGDAGNDRIVGASGEDVIVGGIGNDRMHGGGGNDVFTFCDNWGVDNVEQLASGTVTLWFASEEKGIWDTSSLTYSDGENSVKVTGVTADKITLMFGDDGSVQFATLTGMGAFFDATTERIFEESGKGILASL